MSRNSAGTYTVPPAVNPVVAGTTITPTWANTTLADIATEMTDSLSRSGKGGMTAPLRTADGTVAAPAHSYTSETGSGWFRHAAGEARLAILGTYRLAVNATTATVNAALTALGKLTASAGLDVTGTVTLLNTTTTGNKIVTSATDAAGVVALTVDADNALTQGSLLDLTNNSTSKYTVDYTGEISRRGGLPCGSSSLASTATTINSTLQTLTGLSFAVEANATYVAELIGATANDNATGAVSFGFSGPAAATTVVYGPMSTSVTDGAAFDDICGPSSAVGNKSSPLYYVFHLINGANAGTVQAKYCRHVAGTATVYKGTTLRWRRVA